MVTAKGTRHTNSERARKRATTSRLRAVHRTSRDGTRYYKVYNLSKHVSYLVFRSVGVWRCNCEAGKAGVLCKHVVRVRDREEKRTKEEALRDATNS